MEPRPGRRALVDGELLAQGQVLEGELAVAADEEGKEPEYVQYEGDHERGLWLASADRSITWLADGVMAKDRPHCRRCLKIHPSISY
jgi:hypothetical protein